MRREGLVSDGGETFNNTWDIKWNAETQQFHNYFTAEIAIPFSSLKFLEGSTRWRFRPYRWNIQSNEQSSWVKVPQNQMLSNLAFMGELRFEKPLGKSKTPISLIPYSNILWNKNFRNNQNHWDYKFGGDAKLAIGDGMNLDLTINPDFSNVEVDDVFTNLTRFELQLPEKRQFFIDNSDLFENYGNTFEEARPFFSRRIGLSKNKAGDLIQNDILGGVRLSGKINQNWRLGFVPRTDIFKAGQAVKRIFYPSKGIFNTHELMVVVVNFWKPTLDYKKTDHFYRLSLETAFRNQATAYAYLINNHVYLNQPFNPSRKSGAEPLPGGKGYNFTSLELNYESNRAQLFTYELESTLGQFYNGSIRSFGAEFGFRIQPWVNFGLSFQYDSLRFPKPYSSADILLMTSKTEVTLSKKLFWNTLIQFSNQRDNLGINSRLQ